LRGRGGGIRRHLAGLLRAHGSSWPPRSVAADQGEQQ
jgi:hypothetical protein